MTIYPLKSRYIAPGLEPLENRFAPAGAILVTGADVGGGPNVRIFDPETNQQTASFFAYDKTFTGGVRVAVGDITADGFPDVITGPGPGGTPQVNVYDGKTLELVSSFLAYDAGFTGGVTVAVGNFDNDPFPEIVTGAGQGGGPNVRIFDFANGLTSLAKSFFAYSPAFRGGVTVAAGNYDGLAGDEIITGAGSGGGPHVKIIQSNGTGIGGFFAFSEQFTGGVYVAVGDLDNNGKSEIITGPGSGGGPNVRVFNGGNASLLSSFFAYDRGFTGGVRVSLTDRDFDGFPEIVTAPGLGGGPEIRIWNGTNQQAVDSFFAYNQAFTGGVQVSGNVRLPVQLNGTFIDPTVQFNRASEIEIGANVLVAPFVLLDANNGPISIGDDTNLQDNVVVVAGENGVAIGDNIILAHGSSVLGSAQIGKTGGLPVFVGFNAVIDGAVIEEDCFISHMVRVAPGIVIHSGTSIKTGKFIQTQEEADNPELGKVTSVSDGERAFMADVLHVNEELAHGHSHLFFEGGILAVMGINLNPSTDFNPVESLPNVGGTDVAAPSFSNRVIGNVTLANTLEELALIMGNHDSIRADEGTPFRFGTILGIEDQFTAHALEHTGIVAGNNNRYGYHSLVHGGSDSSSSSGSITEGTTLGNDITLGDFAVVFRSTIEDGVTLGFRSFIDNSLIKEGSTIPDRAIYINNVYVGLVEW